MSSKHKEHVKSLKGPDQFQVQVMSWMDWAMKNIRLIGFVVVPLALLAVGAFGFQFIQAKRKDARLEELGKVEIVYDAEMRKAADARQVIQKKIEALDPKPAASASASAKATADKPAAPEATPVDAKTLAQKAVLTKEAEAIKPDHAESTGKFLEYYKKYESTPEGWMAGMTASRLLIEQDKLTEARPILENVLAKSKDSPFYQMQARLTLISVLEEQGEYDKGLVEIDALEKQVDKDLKPRVLLARGRLQMLKNSKADAKATFNTLIENHGTSPEAQKARSIQALLN